MITLEHDKWYRCKEKNGLAISGFKIKVQSQMWDMYVVCFDDPSMYNQWLDRNTGQIQDTNWIVDLDSDLSYGQQNNLFKCTCGGYTTYQSYSAEYHSSWCDTRKG